MTDIDLDFSISRLGECPIPSPMGVNHFVRDDELVLYHDKASEVKACIQSGQEPPRFETAGPREKIYFDPKGRFTEKDMVLITYGDMVEGQEHSPLASLHKFVATTSRGAINTLHLLPFFPYSSDRGFSVVDDTRVDPKLGTWEDIQKMGLDYDLMLDGVLNHCSSEGRMFRHFLNGNPSYRDFFIAYDSPDDLTPALRVR